MHSYGLGSLIDHFGNHRASGDVPRAWGIDINCIEVYGFCSPISPRSGSPGGLNSRSNMLRKLLLSTALMALLVPALRAQSVDDIIAKNIQARGGMDKIKSVQTIRSSGKIEMGPMEAPGAVI